MNERSQWGEDSRRRRALRPVVDSVRRGALSQDRPARITASLASLWSSERAVAAVELALILPVLMLILLGTIDLGRFGFAAITVSNAARTGAAYCVYEVEVGVCDDTDPDTLAQIVNRVLSEAGFINIDPAQVDVTRLDTGTGCPCLRVAVAYEFTTLVPWPGLPESFWIGRQAQVPIGIEKL